MNKIKADSTPNVPMHVSNDETVKMHIGSNDKNVKFRTNQQMAVPSYNILPDKPSINGEVLQGNKLSEDLHLQHEMDEITEQDIDRIIFGI